MRSTIAIEAIEHAERVAQRTGWRLEIAVAERVAGQWIQRAGVPWSTGRICF